MFGKSKQPKRTITVRKWDGGVITWTVPDFVPDPPVGYATVLFQGGGAVTIHMLRCEQCGALVQEAYDDFHTEDHARRLQPFAS